MERKDDERKHIFRGKEYFVFYFDRLNLFGYE